MRHLRCYGCGIAVTVFIASGCGSAAENQPTADPASTATTPRSDTSPSDGSTHGTAPVPDNGSTSESDTGANTDALCNGAPCEVGQSCIAYAGFAGNRLYICGVPCNLGAPNDGCPESMKCQVIPDGPTQCVNK